MVSFVQALLSQDFGAAIKLLDEAIALQDDLDALSLLFNRGYCYTRLKLWRKAMKVGTLNRNLPDLRAFDHCHYTGL